MIILPGSNVKKSISSVDGYNIRANIPTIKPSNEDDYE